MTNIKTLHNLMPRHRLL